MERIVDIETDGRHLATSRGFMTVSAGREEAGRVPLDDILAVIVHAHGVTYSNNLLVALTKRRAGLVVCASNHAPVACLWPLDGHHEQGARMRAQLAATLPLRKQAWRHIVAAKIRMQGAILEAAGRPTGAFDLLARKVRSGDPENVEAQAARRYWPLLMGEDFRRDQGGSGANALLNYGYTVLRAATSRAVAAAGLHPTLGVHHANRANSFALADDLMEPFRPLVDWSVLRCLRDGTETLCPETKRHLVAVIGGDIRVEGERSTVSTALQRLAGSYARACLSGKPGLVLPEPPSGLDLAGLAPP
ncbi:MAG: type II CRISPR-associated endonuclease Cas1 [Pseudomonadota bacterium]